jgi:hypothetical protein
VNSVKIEIKWAIIFFVATLLWMWLERLVGLHDQYIEKHAVYTNFFAIIAIAIYVLALLNKRRAFYQGTMTYWQGVQAGLWLTLFIVLLVPLAQFITHTWITPDYFHNISQHAVSLEQMTPDQAQAYFSLPHYIQLSVIMAAVMGFVTTLVVAVFTRRSN